MKKRTVRSWTCALHAPSVGEYSVHHSTVTPAVTPRFGRDSYYCLATVLLQLPTEPTLSALSTKRASVSIWLVSGHSAP